MMISVLLMIVAAISDISPLDMNNFLSIRNADALLDKIVPGDLYLLRFQLQSLENAFFDASVAVL